MGHSIFRENPVDNHIEMHIIVSLTAFIHSVFIGVSDRQEEHGNIRRLKETSRINEDIKNYKDWMKKAGTCCCSMICL